MSSGLPSFLVRLQADAHEEACRCRQVVISFHQQRNDVMQGNARLACRLTSVAMLLLSVDSDTDARFERCFSLQSTALHAGYSGTDARSP